MAWYMETMNTLGKWTPAKVDHRPEVSKGRLVRAEGAGPRVRRVTEIPDWAETYSLHQLQQAYEEPKNDT